MSGNFPYRGRVAFRQELRARSATQLILASPPRSQFLRHRRQLWVNCQPYAFRGGTERFLADYRSPGPEWRYVWPRDGWLGSAAMPGAPPPSYYQGSPESYNPDPQW